MAKAGAVASLLVTKVGTKMYYSKRKRRLILPLNDNQLGLETKVNDVCAWSLRPTGYIYYTFFMLPLWHYVKKRYFCPLKCTGFEG